MECRTLNMQQGHKGQSGARKKSYRYRLPEGYSGLIDGVGDILRRARARSPDCSAMSPSHFAALLEVRRETLSRIDNGKKLPSYRTLQKYLDLLDMDFDDVAQKCEYPGPFIPDYPEVCIQLGEALDAGRKAKELTLRQLSEHTGISYSQLSRLTRGQFKGGKHVEVKYIDGHRKFDSDTMAWFTHPMLDYLSEIGGFRRDLGRRTG